MNMVVLLSRIVFLSLSLCFLLTSQEEYNCKAEAHREKAVSAPAFRIRLSTEKPPVAVQIKQFRQNGAGSWCTWNIALLY